MSLDNKIAKKNKKKIFNCSKFGSIASDQVECIQFLNVNISIFSNEINLKRNPFYLENVSKSMKFNWILLQMSFLICATATAAAAHRTRNIQNEIASKLNILPTMYLH